MDASRATNLFIGGISLPLPCFFPSISSVKTNLSPLEYLRLMLALKQPHFLISAYDIYKSDIKSRKKFSALLKKASSINTVVLLDSGNYEKYWKADPSWTPDHFASVLKSYTFQLAFSFDEKDSPSSKSRIISSVEAGVLRDQRWNKGATIAPIVHAPTPLLPAIVKGIAKRLNPLMIAVPERRLGDGIIARATSVFRIRKALESLGHYYPIHLLGTGNPFSLLIFSLCGADSFDGLEWCQTCVDAKSGLLHHFQQREFLGNHCLFDRSSNLPYDLATLGHNLFFYRFWMAEIQHVLQSGKGQELARQYLPKEGLALLRKHIPEVFE